MEVVVSKFVFVFGLALAPPVMHESIERCQVSVVRLTVCLPVCSSVCLSVCTSRSNRLTDYDDCYHRLSVSQSVGWMAGWIELN